MRKVAEVNMNRISGAQISEATPSSHGHAHAGGAPVEFEQVTKLYGSAPAVDALDLSIRPGEFLTLLGPSGSGKSTLLMLLAGFERPTSGSIKVAGRDLNRVPPNRRDQGVVFQSYALFPHMTARENLAYPLDARGIGAAEKAGLIASALDRVRMSHLADRYPNQLSGGQQQRVALARAIVFKPPLLLMDESLSALDRNLREEMQYELKILHEQLATTIVYVTHDQGEALTMSDRIAVLSNGRMVQLGTPKSIYDNPANRFVARFIGDSNFIEGNVCGISGPEALITIGGDRSLRAMRRDDTQKGDSIRAMVRPEAIEIARVAAAPPPGSVPFLTGEVTRAIFVGGSFRYWLDADGIELCCSAPSTARHEAIGAGEKVRISIHPEDLKIIPD